MSESGSLADLDSAFSSVLDEREAARTSIIQRNELPEFRKCVDRARREQDLENLEFWLIEIATSAFGLDEIALSVIELAEDVHIPEKRFAEATLYIRYIHRAVVGDAQKRASEIESKCQSGLISQTGLVVGDGWKEFDLTKPLEEGKDQQYNLDRLVAYFFHVNDETMAPLFEQFKTSFLPNVIGFLNGLASGIQEYGVNRDTVCLAFMTFMDLAYPNFRPGVPRRSSPATPSKAPQARSTDEQVKPVSTRSPYGISKN
jgi:hypothetical protein